MKTKLQQSFRRCRIFLVKIGASEVNSQALFENKDKFTLSFAHGVFFKCKLDHLDRVGQTTRHGLSSGPWLEEPKPELRWPKNACPISTSGL